MNDKNYIEYLKEDSYGYKKRLKYLSDYILNNKKIKNVLEIGCGTGFGLLYPIAKFLKIFHFMEKILMSKV